MKNFTYLTKACTANKLYSFSLLALGLLVSFNAAAQPRNYSIIYTENMKGGATIFGNTLMNLVNADGSVNTTAMNDNAANGFSTFTNGNADMEFVDIDGSTGDGAATKNSSSSDLILPAGTNTIKMARLYWGGRIFTPSINISLPANRTVKIRKGTSGPYLEYAAFKIDTILKNAGTPNEFLFYQAYVDVTQLMQDNGAGTYTVGNIPLTSGNGGVAGNYGGWSIMVVYENPALDYNSVRVYDGFREVFNGGSAVSNSAILTGLDVPSGALSLEDARMSVMVWEGDANYTGDFLKINGNTFSNAINQANNPWNGTISKDGVHVTTKSPNYTNQMGIDIDEFNVGTGYGILPNATSVDLEFGTELDQYFPGIFTFVIKMKDPNISLSKTVTDANNNKTAEPGEVLTYKLKGKNLGAGNATAVIVSDTLPSTITYVANSIKVNYSPGVVTGPLTDAANDDNGEYTENGSIKTIQLRMGNGSGAVNGGSLASLDSFEVQFQVTVNTAAPGESQLPIINTARFRANSQSLVSFVDDATVVINPQGGPLPVTLKSFTASLATNSLVKVNWVTSMEINSKKYDIERSIDARLFNTVATISGGGNTSSEKSYSISDDVTAVTASIVYYRLKQVDFDGKASYSKVVSVKLKKGIKDFTVSPNPFRSYVNINIDWAKNETTAVKVFNMTGRELISKNIQMAKGTNYVSIIELAALPAGNYILQLNNADGRIYKQITKQ